jgi:hypothetical protein
MAGDWGPGESGGSDQMSGFKYAIYIQDAPELAWQGLTDPALMKRY